MVGSIFRLISRYLPTTTRVPTPPHVPLEQPPQVGVGTVPPSSSVIGSSNESLMIMYFLIDLKLLNCPNCVKPWNDNTMIMQCVNRHSVCNSCYLRLDKCPSCRRRLVVRNLALEDLFKKMLMSHCKNYVFGCRYEPLTAESKLGHELKCPYTPCFCPFPGCHFTHSSKNLYDHFSATHMRRSRYAMKFKFGTNFSLNSTRAGTWYLQEENEGVMFIFDNRIDRENDRLLFVECLGPPWTFDRAFTFDIEAKCMRRSTQLTKQNPKITTKWEPSASNEYLFRILPEAHGEIQTPFNLLIEKVHPIEVV